MCPGLAVDLLGADALELADGRMVDGWQYEYLQSYSLSIAGGTSEIMRNIIGERVLGLPR